MRAVSSVSNGHWTLPIEYQSFFSPWNAISIRLIELLRHPRMNSFPLVDGSYLCLAYGTLQM